MLLRFLTLAAALLVTQGPAFEGTLRLRTIELPLEQEALQVGLLDLSLAALAAREDAKVEESTLRIKNNVIHMENQDASQKGFALLDFGRRVMVMVDSAQRMYLEFPLMGPPPMQGSGAPPLASRTPRNAGPTPRPLGSRTINGIAVNGYEVQSEDLLVRAWMTQAYPGLTWTFRSAAAMPGNDSGDPEDDATAALARYGYPILMFTLTPSSLRVEETRGVVRGALSADLFRVPAGFMKQSMPAMPGGPE